MCLLKASESYMYIDSNFSAGLIVKLVGFAVLPPPPKKKMNSEQYIIGFGFLFFRYSVICVMNGTIRCVLDVSMKQSKTITLNLVVDTVNDKDCLLLNAF